MTRRKRKRKDPAAVALRRKGAKSAASGGWPTSSRGELLETMQKLPRRLRSRKGGCA